MRLERNLIPIEKIKKNLSEGAECFLEGVCELMPLKLTLYEEKGMCAVQRESCKYSEFLEGGDYLCKKKTYTLSEAPKLQFF